MQARATTSSQHCATDSHYMEFPLAVGGRVKHADSTIHNETARTVCAVSLYHQGLLQLGKNGFFSAPIFSKQEHYCYFDHLRSTRVSSIVAEGSGQTESNVPLTTSTFQRIRRRMGKP